MKNLKSWLFIIIAIVWLLPLINVDQLGEAGTWIAIIAIALIGILGLMNK